MHDGYKQLCWDTTCEFKSHIKGFIRDIIVCKLGDLLLASPICFKIKPHFKILIVVSSLLKSPKYMITEPLSTVGGAHLPRTWPKWHVWNQLLGHGPSD